MDDYTAKAKVMVKVLYFVKFGGPKRSVLSLSQKAIVVSLR